MLKYFNHDLLHKMFIWAAADGILPKYPQLEAIPEITNRYQNVSPLFSSPLGVRCGLDWSGGCSVDGLFDLGGVSYVEIGPCTIDP